MRRTALGKSRQPREMMAPGAASRSPLTVLVLLLLLGLASGGGPRLLSLSLRSSRLQGPTDVKAVGRAPALVSPYSGPIQDLEAMVAGCDVSNLGLQILVGPSMVCDGLGLFVKLNDETESSLQPRGTPLCGYSRGKLVDEAEGTFTVAYLFTDPKNGVIFQQRIMPLVEAVGLASSLAGSESLESIVVGHKLLWDSESEEILVTPDETYSQRYFVPDPVALDSEGMPQWGVANLGMYANDCAYSEDATEEQYISTTASKNVLQIVWRMEMRDGKLSPSWPVVVTLGDVHFTNKEPMEVGLQYSWKYWAAARALREEQEQEQREQEERGK